MAEVKKNKKGGKRPGAGRPSGAKNVATLERNKVLEGIRQRVMQKADFLFDKQLQLAAGQQFLYKIEKEYIDLGETKGGKKKGYYKAKRPKLVTEEWEIRAYLENLVDKVNGDIEDEFDPAATYYFITTKEPSNQALDSMLDRTFGRATQPVSGEDGGAIEVTVVKYATEAAKKAENNDKN